VTTAAAVVSDVTSQESPSQREVTSTESETETQTIDAALSAETTSAGKPLVFTAVAVATADELATC